MKNLRLLVPVLASIFVIQQAAFAQQSVGSSAPAASPAMKTEANDFYQRQEWSNAAKAYEAITKLEPANAGAWVRLGVAQHSLGKYQSAVEAYKHAIDAGAQWQAMYNLACSYARLNDKEQALAWLSKAVQAGYSQPQTMSADVDLASLRNEAQFNQLVSQAQVNAKPCTAQPLNRQFDFWVGEWNVLSTQGQQQIGQSSVQLILGDCVVFENWTGGGGLSGKSFNFYNAAKGKWQQNWVDDHGGSLELTGELKNGEMRYTAEAVAANGAKTLHRLTFYNLPANRVRQFWETSTDGGKTWTVAFDGTYVRK